MGAGGTAAGYVISHLVEPYVGPPVFVSTVRCSPQSEGVPLSWGDRGHNTLAPAMGHAPACTRARRPRTRAMQRCAPYLVSGGFRRQHTVVQIRKRVINLFDCSQCRLIGVIEHIALRQFAHVPASRQVHPRTVRFAGIVSSS